MTPRHPKLRHFRPEEFRCWWPRMDPRLLERLDEFRHRLRVPVMISPANGALGRHLGMNSRSRHNVDMWGSVMAADVMLPRGPILGSHAMGEQVVRKAVETGFGGIGIYLDWQPYPGMHLDIRPLKPDGSPATWTRVGEDYVALIRAWEQPQENIT